MLNVVTVIHMAVELLRAMEPGTGADKNAVPEPFPKWKQVDYTVTPRKKSSLSKLKSARLKLY
jgi:hypothetical protein